jgi:hypothetical protein
MNRYDIQNIATGVITHSYQSNNPNPYNPSWGKLQRWQWEDLCTPQEIASALQFEDVIVLPARQATPEMDRTRYYLAGLVWKWAEECTPQEIASAIRSETLHMQAVDAAPAVTRRRYLLPQTYAVIITDITSDITQETQNQVTAQNLLNRIRQLNAQSDLTTADLKEAVIKLMKYLFFTHRVGG